MTKSQAKRFSRFEDLVAITLEQEIQFDWPLVRVGLEGFRHFTKETPVGPICS